MPPTKPTLPVFDAMRREHADEERALVLLEDDRLDVRQVHDRVDDGELGLGNSLATFSMRAGLGEADADHRIGAAPGHVAQRLLALGLGW